MLVKRERMDEYSGDRPSQQSSSSNSNVQYSVTNENWRGKNDPAERRRIQNRLNQRAFRERQRAGHSPKPYKPRSTSAGSSREGEAQRGSHDEEEEQANTDEGRSSSTATMNQPNVETSSSTGHHWDELGQLINRNFIQAAYSNAQSIGITVSDFQTGTSLLTPQPSQASIPVALQPIKLQHEVPHDPIIDIIPHARLRYNILRGIALRQLSSVAFSASLRASGALLNVGGHWQREGLVVWDAPEKLSSWELSEMFIQRWGSLLLQDCEDLLAATNAWRSRRGETLFPATLAGR